MSDEKPAPSGGSLEQAIRAAKPGDTIELTIGDADSKRQLEQLLDSMASAPAADDAAEPAQVHRAPPPPDGVPIARLLDRWLRADRVPRCLELLSDPAHRTYAAGLLEGHQDNPVHLGLSAVVTEPAQAIGGVYAIIAQQAGLQRLPRAATKPTAALPMALIRWLASGTAERRARIWRVAGGELERDPTITTAPEPAMVDGEITTVERVRYPDGKPTGRVFALFVVELYQGTRNVVASALERSIDEACGSAVAELERLAAELLGDDDDGDDDG